MPAKKTPAYDCGNCLAYCCSSAFAEVDITEKDVVRLAEHLGLTRDMIHVLFVRTTKDGDMVLPRKSDSVLEGKAGACVFLDTETRKCTIYEGRPDTCRDFPYADRCGFYEALQFQRAHEEDPRAVVKIEVLDKTFSVPPLKEKTR